MKRCHILGIYYQASPVLSTFSVRQSDSVKAASLQQSLHQVTPHHTRFVLQLLPCLCHEDSCQIHVEFLQPCQSSHVRTSQSLPWGYKCIKTSKVWASLWWLWPVQQTSCRPSEKVCKVKWWCC